MTEETKTHSFTKVRGIEYEEFAPKPPFLGRYKIGDICAVRPVTDNPENKSYLGVYLGDLPTGIMHSIKGDELIPMIGAFNRNPAIYCFELKRVVMGYESWWCRLDAIEDFKEITNADIDSVWYVQILKAMATKDAEPE